VIRTLCLLAAALAALSPLPAAAATWFFRPDNGAGYGQRDGTSYANAWHLDDRQSAAGRVDWSRIRPGDTLYVCGFHHGGRDVSLRPTVSGTAFQPIVIDGNCPGGSGADPGVMLLGAARFTGGWSGPDRYGAYSRPYGGSTSSQVLEDTDDTANGTAGLVRLKRRTGPPDASWSCGSFAQEGGGARLYYKPSDVDGAGGCDAPHWVYTEGNDSISFVAVRYLTLRNLVLMHQDRLVSLVDADDIVIENNELRWASDVGIRARQDSDEGSILNNTIRAVRNGIYMENQVDFDNANTMDGWVIAGNEIYNVDQYCYYACQVPVGRTADTHAIAFQGGTGNLIERNHIHHVGGDGILFYAMRQQTIRDNVIQHNFIHDVKDLNPDTASHPERNERGIEHATSNDELPRNTVKNIVRYNVLANVDGVGIRLKSSKPPSGYSWSVLNNVIYRAGTSFAFAGDTSAYTAANKPGFRFQNNISAEPLTGLHLDQIGALDPDTSGIVIGNNLFHPDATPGVFRYDWGGRGATSYETLAAWQSVSGRAGGIAADPLFNDPAGTFHWAGFPQAVTAGGDFGLQPASPAINAGAYVTDSGKTDMDGVRIVNKRDIGAYEAR
jgi:hypothetical protein